MTAAIVRKRPQQQRSQAKVDAIVTAAIQVLQREPLDCVTTTRIAERAGVSVGTLYQYFRDRDQVLAAVAARQTAELAEVMRRAGETTTGWDLPAACAEHIDGVLAVYSDYAALAQLPQARALVASPASLAHFQTGRQWLAGSINRYLPQLSSPWATGVAGSIMTATRELLLEVQAEGRTDWRALRGYLINSSRSAIESAAASTG